MQAREFHDLDAGALQTSFEEAIHHVHHNAIPGLTEEIEKRLFGLFQQVMAGPAPAVCPEGSTEEQRIKWEVHATVGKNLSRPQAMQAYVDLVGAADPRFLFKDGEEEEGSFCGFLQCWQHSPCVWHSRSRDRGEQNNDKEKQDAEEDVNVSFTSYDVDRPVYELAEARDLKRLVAALSQGADPNSCDESGVTGLMWAADSGNEEIAKALLAQLPTLDVNKQDDEGQTALHYCVQCDSFEVAKRLIDAGAEVSLVDKEGHSALDLAIQEEMEDYVQLFLGRGMMPIDNGKLATV